MSGIINRHTPRDGERLTIYYDASCPLCVSEMAVVKSRDVGGLLALVDCSGTQPLPGPRMPDEAGVTREALMRALHARTADGRWLVGVPAYEAIFRATGFPRLARLAGSARLAPLLARSYAWVARNRYRLPRRGIARLLALASRRNARAS